MNEPAPCPAPGKNGRPGRKRLLIAGGFSLGVILLIGIIGAALLLAPWQDIPAIYPQREDFQLQNRLLRRFFKEFSDRKNLPERSILKLTPEEVNSLFRIAANFQGRDLPYPVRYYRPAFSGKGVFSLTIPMRTWMGTVYTKAAFSITKGPEGLRITPVFLKVGRIPLPGSGSDGITAGILESQIAEVRQDPNYELFDQAVESISFDGSHLVVIYRPRKLLGLIFP